MESDTPHEDNWDAAKSRQSLPSAKKDSRESSFQKNQKNARDKIQDEDEKQHCTESRSKTRARYSDPDRDQISDGEGRRSSRSYYSEDYENNSLSERSISPYSQSRTPSPSPQRQRQSKRISRSKKGGAGLGMSPSQRSGGQRLSQQHPRGVRSLRKESTSPKDLDMVTKRMLSARLLKINELRNALAEMQQRTDELQKENRILRQLQVRQEKALQGYDDTESKISQLLSRHNNDIHVLRERLRRTQERERAAERQLKDSEEQLHRSQATNVRLKKLVDQRELGARDELSHKLEEEKARVQEAERKIKELERSTELSNSSFKRQLATERKKTLSAQEEIRTLQEELERVAHKLKKKERELDAKNIYANRMMEPSLRKDINNGTRQKIPSRSSTKAVQTKDRAPSMDFPTPPPAIDANEYSEQAPDEYLSLKELDRVTEDQQNMREREKDEENELVKEKEEKQQLNLELNVLEEKAKRTRDGRKNEKEKEDTKRTSSLLNQEEENNRKSSLVQEEVRKWNQAAPANQQATEEARRKKELLLAKMFEIDQQNQGARDTMFAESSPSESNKEISNHFPSRLPEQRNHTSSIFNLTEATTLRAGAGSREEGSIRSGVEGGAAVRRRALRSQTSSDDLAFGSYAPSFGNPASRGSSGFPPPPPTEERESALEAIGVFGLRGMETEKEKETERDVAKDRKSRLMEQLFGTQPNTAGDFLNAHDKMDAFNSPPNVNGVRSRREGLNFNSGSPSTSLNTFHVADRRPVVRAIASFDDDLEELTL